MIAAGQTTFIPQSVTIISPLMTMQFTQMSIIPWQQQNTAFQIPQIQYLIQRNTGRAISAMWRPEQTAGRDNMPIKEDIQIKAFIFDNDGVVINSEPLIFEATARIFSAYGIDLKKEDVQKGIGAGSKYVEYPREKYGLVNVSVEELMRAREDEFRILASNKLKPFPGFFTLMKLLRKRGIRTALASSAATEVVYHNLSLAGIEPRLFDHIVDSTRIKNKKPAPDIFLAASDNLGIPPCNCLVIEDAPPGIEAARRAEMKVVALSTTLPKSFLTNSDYVVDSFEDLIDRVDEFIEGFANGDK